MNFRVKKNKYFNQFKTLIFNFASFLNQSVTFSHLLLFSSIKLPFPPYSKLTVNILVEFNRQYLLRSSIKFELQPFKILISTLFSFAIIFGFSKPFLVSSGLTFTYFFFIIF